jgi:hypothetical protein
MDNGIRNSGIYHQILDIKPELYFIRNFNRTILFYSDSIYIIQGNKNMKSPINIIYNFIEIIYSFDWFALIITLGVAAITIFIGLLVISPMGIIPI